MSLWDPMTRCLPLLWDPQDIWCHLRSHCPLPATAQAPTGPVVLFWAQCLLLSELRDLWVTDQQQAGGRESRGDTIGPVGP